MSTQSNGLAALPKDRLLAEISIWSANLLRLGEDMARIDAFTDLYHVDVADGHFSPTLLFFPDLVGAMRKATHKPIHVHLMASDDILEEQIRQFAGTGADLISIHAENVLADTALELITSLGVLSGVVLQLHTPISSIEKFLDRVAMVTLLGTAIGIKGQGLDAAALPRLAVARALVDAKKLQKRVLLAADGGIREHTVPALRAAGADTVVMGSLAFAADDLRQRVAWLQSLAKADGR